MSKETKIMVEKQINYILEFFIKNDIPLPVYLEVNSYYNDELIYDTAICESCNEYYEVDFEHYNYCPNFLSKIRLVRGRRV